MTDWKKLADIRREYGELSLNEDTVQDSPIAQFKIWFEDVMLIEKSDPTAMVLSTIDDQGHPDSRVVLLKGLEDGAFVFYTNYQSSKALQIESTPFAAINFYWPEMARQVRIRGSVKRVSAQQSDAYFASRPITSQLSAIASPQSRKIAERRILEEALTALIIQHGQESILRPQHWGGYKLIPDEIEFWQGRDNRLHDRILYKKAEENWSHCRLAP